MINGEGIADLLRGESSGEIEPDNDEGAILALGDGVSVRFEACSSIVIADTGDDGDGGAGEEGLDEAETNASVGAGDDVDGVVVLSSHGEG